MARVAIGPVCPEESIAHRGFIVWLSLLRIQRASVRCLRGGSLIGDVVGKGWHGRVNEGARRLGVT